MCKIQCKTNCIQKNGLSVPIQQYIFGLHLFLCALSDEKLSFVVQTCTKGNLIPNITAPGYVIP